MTQPSVSVRLQFRWQFLGKVQAGSDGRVVFPDASRQPGLYRFRFAGKGASRHYVGETDELRRRFQHYRTPDPSQKTNIRMNAEFRKHLAAGGSVEVDIVVDNIDVIARTSAVGVDLSNKAMRRLLEHAALIDEAAAGAMLLNR